MASYLQVATGQLDRLCAATGLLPWFLDFARIQRLMLAPWGDTEVPAQPPYASEIGDDHSPYEYSLAFEPTGVQLRFLVEAQGFSPGVATNAGAAIALTQKLHTAFGIGLKRLRTVADLFLTEAPQAPFTLWHAVTFAPTGQAEFKAYLNPAARGGPEAPRLLHEALDRLGFGHVVDPLFEHATRRGTPLDEPAYFSLDLSEAAASRVKVYFRHACATADDFERAFAWVPSHRPGDAHDFLRTVAGHAGPFDRKPVTTCFSFVEGKAEPLAATMHLPIAHYAQNDADVVDRVSRFLDEHGMDAGLYRRAVETLSRRPLRRTLGVQSYASYRRVPAGLRFTAYLSPMLFGRASAPAHVPPPLRAAV